MERKRRVLSPSAGLIRRSLISGLPAVLPYLLSMLILFTGITFQFVLTYDSKFAPYLQQNSSPTLRSIYRYVLFESDGLLPLQICVLLAPVVLGICLFRFMASKRTVNVYYSLGFSRQSLFWCRYMAGELLLLLASLIPVAANVFLNLAYFGSSRGLWIAAGSVLAALVILSSLSFAVTALVFSCVGTIGEGALYSVLLLLSPTILLSGAEGLMNCVWGNPYGATFETMEYNSVLFTMISSYQQVQPLFLLKASVGQAFEQCIDAQWGAPHVFPLLLWALVAIGAAALGSFLFRRRKAEICGFLGKSKVLNVCVVGLIGFFCYGAVLKVASPLPAYVAVLLGVLAYAAVYCFFYLALTRDAKRFCKRLRFLPLHLGAVVLLGVFAVTGFGGFSSYVPEVSQVQSAAVVMPNQSIQITGYNGSGGNDEYRSLLQGDLISGFTSPNDLALITKLHQNLATSGKQPLRETGPRKEQVVHTVIQFVYTLKDGRQVRRHYDRIAFSQLMQFLQLEDSDRYHAMVREVLTGAPDPEAFDRLNSWKSELQASDLIRISGKWMAKEQALHLNKKQRMELLQCISDDFCAQTAQERYHPSSPELGTVAFARSDSRTDFSKQPVRQVSGSYGSFRIAITKDMTNTLHFLRQQGVADLLEEIPEIRKLSVIQANGMIPQNLGSSGTFPYVSIRYAAQEFHGRWVKNLLSGYESFYSNGPAISAFRHSRVILDQKEIEEIMAHAYLHYFLDTEGYYILVEFEDQMGNAVLFLPEKEAPQWLSQRVNQSSCVQP